MSIQSVPEAAGTGPKCSKCYNDLHFVEARKIPGYAGDHDRGQWICNNHYCSQDQELEIR